jgi:hypothetical protein
MEDFRKLQVQEELNARPDSTVRSNPIFHTSKRRLKNTIIGHSIEVKDPMTPKRDGRYL